MKDGGFFGGFFLEAQDGEAERKSETVIKTRDREMKRKE